MHRVRWWLALASLTAVAPLLSRRGRGTGERRPLPATNVRARAASQGPAGRPLQRDRIERLPAVVRTAANIEFAAPQTAGIASASRIAERATGEVVATPQPIAGATNVYAIDLPTALQLADANNLLVAAAREQIGVALARVDTANALWLPSIRGGVNYNRHDGSIQDVHGIQFNTTRSALYAGAGAGVYGAGTPLVPGIYSNFHLADVLFQPLAARQFAGSRNRAAVVETNNTLLQVTLGYFELLRAGEDAAILEATRTNAQRLADLTAAYAETGEGLPADANRARAELMTRMVEVQRARESQRVASARLSQLLRLDPAVMLLPADAAVAPIEIFHPDLPVRELVAQGLGQRPELAENQQLVAEAASLLRREKMAPFVPSFLLGASYGGMGAGINTQIAPFHDRFDFDAVAYWEMRNLGFGEAAARRGAAATVRSSRLRYLAMMDQVAREIVEAQRELQCAERRCRWPARVSTRPWLRKRRTSIESNRPRGCRSKSCSRSRRWPWLAATTCGP